MDRWIRHNSPPTTSPSPVVVKEGKSSRPFVFTLHTQQLSSRPVQTLDVAADSLEDLTAWVAKIREAAQNADARVAGARTHTNLITHTHTHTHTHTDATSQIQLTMTSHLFSELLYDLKDDADILYYRPI